MLETRLDTMWMLVSAVLVMSMQLGFCMLESGLVRSKNTINVAIKILLDFCMAGVLYWALAFGLMFGNSPTGWFGTNDFFFEPGKGLHDFPFFLFQLMFCATTATIVSGAVAERMRFTGYLMITVLVSALIYPVAGSWAWNPDGWLAKMGFVDFAGSLVVHSTGGWVAFAAIAVLGARTGRFDSRYPLSSAHSLGVATFGVLVLFVAWLGFNGGSMFALNESVPIILTNTVLAGCAGCLVALTFTWIRKGLPLLPPTLNGCIAGLVSISAACHCVRVYEAFIIGAVGGLICCLALIALEKMKLDDSVGASAAHALPGVWGTITVALFGDPALIKTGLEFWPQLQVQLLGALVFSVWAAGVGWLLIWLLNKVYRLRVSEESERVGLNVSEHGASTEIVDLLNEMGRHSSQGEFSMIHQFTPYSEVGQIAGEYNRVINKIVSEIEMREAMAARLSTAQQAAERTNRKILDSLEYAKSIQRGILPPGDLLDRLIPDHFVIFKPRDWVSGDFYWCLQAERSTYLAVVDCTGHGVPGAFMSMIGFVLLEQIVLDRKIREPGQILAELHQRVRAVLGQDGANSESQDGMDVCLVRIDDEAVYFAGARRPLWFMSGGSRVFREIPGERSSIGGGRHEPPELEFASHRLPRRGRLTLFLSSDGIVDQPNHLRQPFDKARIRELVSRMHDLPMKEQGAQIARELEEFQGGAEQRDDMTLLGLRVGEAIEDSAWQVTDAADYAERVRVRQPVALFAGPFSGAELPGYLKEIKAQLALEPNAEAALASVFVEMAQNVARYSAERISDQGVGVLWVTRSESGYGIHCANLITPAQRDHLRVELDQINPMDDAALRRLRKQRLREEAPPGSKGARVGLIEIRRRSTKPVEYAFLPAGNERMFLTLMAHVSRESHDPTP